ncbi:DUF4340 domain-containing protein [Hyalangium versicolor]|uniref:DUF4340 domain-containing protein n=1 Tax=Hyalangium versicolor TaxID=2861190 RepID=UPI001CCE1C16|nr:DUF4340 domain-containing protein [Hyalangium versicolor]
MNARGVALQGGLAALGLLAALLTWQREPEGMPGEVTVLDISKRALQRVRYDDATRFVEVFREQDGELWVRLGDKPKPPPPPAAAADGGVGDGGVASGPTDAGTAPVATTGAGDAGVAAAPPAPPPPPPPPRELRANQTAETLFGRLAPLKGTRALGDLDAKKLEELGLVNSPRKLTFTVDGREQVLTIAAPAGAAWGSPYALREDNKVFLLGSAVLPDFEGGMNRLVDRRLHTFEESEYDSFTVTQGKSSRAFVVSGKPPKAVTVAPQTAPDKPDEFVHNWHDRIWRMLPVDVLGRGEEPPGGAPEEVFRVDYRKGTQALGYLSVARGEKGEFYAKTEHTAGWVRFHSGLETVVNEAVKVASGT